MAAWCGRSRTVCGRPAGTPSNGPEPRTKALWLPAAFISTGCRRRLGLKRIECRPQVAHEFASHGDDDLVVVNAAPCHPHEPSMQSLLRPVGDGDDMRRLPLATLAQRLTRHGPMAMVPGGLDQQ